MNSSARRPLSATPVSSVNSRRASASGSSPASSSPFAIDQAPASFFAQYGPPGWTRKNSGARPIRRKRRSPALVLRDMPKPRVPAGADRFAPEPGGSGDVPAAVAIAAGVAGDVFGAAVLQRHGLVEVAADLAVLALARRGRRHRAAIAGLGVLPSPGLARRRLRQRLVDALAVHFAVGGGHLGFEPA